MKTRYFLFALLLVASRLCAYETVTISDPNTWKTSDISKYQGQTITFTNPFYVISTGSGSLTISPRHSFYPTNQAIPKSTEYYSIISANKTGNVTLNGISGTHRTNEAIVNLTVKINSNSSWTAVGTPTYAWNSYSYIEKGIESVNQKDTANLLVCALNLQYYLVKNLGTGSQGPTSASQQSLQHTKIMAALKKINADIYGFVEVEQGDDALAKLASSLTSATGRTYNYISDGGSASGTFTKSGYVYCEKVVKPIGGRENPQGNHTGVSNRKYMQGFTIIDSTNVSNGESFIFSINHFKAKVGSGTGSDADQGDGQGCFNASRVIEAKSVVSAANGNESYYHDPDVLVMGDLNSYGKEDPIIALVKGGFTDLNRFFHADSAYSYMYNGKIGYLDHALANKSMLAQVTGVTTYHINSDEPDSKSYKRGGDGGSMYRCSDHDPVIVGLRLDHTKTIELETKVRNFISISNGERPIIENANGGYYSIYTPSGLCLVAEQMVTATPFTVTDELQRGIYIIRVHANGETKQDRIIVY